MKNKDKALNMLVDSFAYQSELEENVKIAIKIASKPDWIKCSDKLPEDLSPKLSFGMNDNNKERILRAIFVPKFTISEEESNFNGDCDLNEEREEYFWPQGWYEWNELEDIHWRVSFEITHWMDLPDSPYLM